MAKATWTEGAVQLAKALWRQGLSASQIARKISELQGTRVTRNAVISKIHRLGLQVRLLPAKPGTSHPRTKQMRRERIMDAATKADAPTRNSGKRYSRAPKRDAESSTQMRWSDHKDFTHCAMFCDGEAESSGYVCGKPCMDNSVYCPECYAVAHQSMAQIDREAA